MQERLDEFFADHSDFRKQFVNPTLQLLARSTSNKSDPGGKWAELFAELTSRIERVEQQGNASQPAQSVSGNTRVPGVSFGWPISSASTGGWSTQSYGGTQVNGQSADQMQWIQGEFQRLKEEMNTLKSGMKDLQEQAESDAIFVGSIVFPSRGFCVSWMARHAVETDPHVFVDAVSLLSLATSDVSLDEERAANLRATTAKVRDKTPYHTAYIASFNLEVPPLLGKGSDQSLTTNSRALGGVPKFEDFHRRRVAREFISGFWITSRMDVGLWSKRLETCLLLERSQPASPMSCYYRAKHFGMTCAIGSFATISRSKQKVKRAVRKCGFSSHTVSEQSFGVCEKQWRQDGQRTLLPGCFWAPCAPTKL